MELVSNVKKKQRRIMRDTKPTNKGMGSSGSELYWTSKDEGNLDVLCNYLNFLIFISVFHSLCLFLALFLLASAAFFFFFNCSTEIREKIQTKAALILQINFKGLFATQTNNWTRSFVM